MTKDEFWALCEPGEDRTVYVKNHSYANRGRIVGTIKEMDRYGDTEYLIEPSDRVGALYVFYRTTTAVV